MTPESHVSEYHDSMVAFLEWIWGRDFMAPGGEGNVDKLVEGIDLAGKRVLDIGISKSMLSTSRPRGAVAVAHFDQ
jgi:phosphoethanolamine N-methyltransferase